MADVTAEVMPTLIGAADGKTAGQPHQQVAVLPAAALPVGPQGGPLLLLLLPLLGLL